MDWATHASNPKLAYKSTNYSKLCSKPKAKYIIHTSRNGFKRLIGSSATFFAMKYANTEYILFDCSRMNTGRSSWNTISVLKKLPINVLIVRKKIVL